MKNLNAHWKVNIFKSFADEETRSKAKVSARDLHKVAENRHREEMNEILKKAIGQSDYNWHLF